jgi:hypothetical protein
MGKMQRDKGARGEREVVDILRAHGLAARRTAQMQSQDAGFMPDVLVEDWPAVWLEVKRQVRPNPRAALLQARREVPIGADSVPIAVTKADRGEWMAMLAAFDMEQPYLRVPARRLRALSFEGKKPRLASNYAFAVEACERYADKRPAIIVFDTADEIYEGKTYLKFEDLLWYWGRDKT